VVREVSTDGTISTIAGTGLIGYNGDEMPATQAQLHTPSAITLGPDGSIYIGDVGNNRVRKISGGVISTVAGDSEPGGYNPTRTVATQTPLDNPYALAVDPQGDIFIADSTNCIIREVSPIGTIATVVGIYPTTPYKTCGWGNGDGLSGPSTELYRPYGLALGAAGNIYIADTYNEVVRVLVVSATASTAQPSATTSTTTPTTSTNPPTTSTTPSTPPTPPTTTPTIAPAGPTGTPTPASPTTTTAIATSPAGRSGTTTSSTLP
jgi:hypothetical protein